MSRLYRQPLITAGSRISSRVWSLDVQLGLNAEGQRDVLPRDVAAAQADGDGTLEVFEGAQNRLLQQIGRRAGRNAIEHLAEDDAVYAFQLAGLAQLPQHAIHLVGLGAHVFKKEQLALGLRLPGRAQQRNENAEAAAVENAASRAGIECAQAFRRADGVRLAG